MVYLNPVEVGGMTIENLQALKKQVYDLMEAALIEQRRQ